MLSLTTLLHDLSQHHLIHRHLCSLFYHKDYSKVGCRVPRWGFGWSADKTLVHGIGEKDDWAKEIIYDHLCGHNQCQTRSQAQTTKTNTKLTQALNMPLNHQKLMMTWGFMSSWPALVQHKLDKTAEDKRHCQRSTLSTRLVAECMIELRAGEREKERER